MNPVESGPTELHVQHIACINNAGFVMRFEIENQDGQRAGDSGTYPIHQSRRIDLANLTFSKPLEVGAVVRPRVHAIAGLTQNGPAVRYAPNGQTATFSVHGTTLRYSIDQA